QQSESAAGRALYDQACQSCHGSAGQGDRGPALNTGHFTHGDDDADLARAIRGGIAGTQMPAFARFNDADVRRIVAYVRTFAPVADDPARRREDRFTTQFVDADGTWHLVDKMTHEERTIAPRDVTASRLEHADVEPQNWLMYWGDYRSTHYSPLTEITAS